MGLGCCTFKESACLGAFALVAFAGLGLGETVAAAFTLGLGAALAVVDTPRNAVL